MESNNEIDEEKGVRGIRLNNGDENNDGTVGSGKSGASSRRHSSRSSGHSRQLSDASQSEYYDQVSEMTPLVGGAEETPPEPLASYGVVDAQRHSLRRIPSEESIHTIQQLPGMVIRCHSINVNTGGRRDEGACIIRPSTTKVVSDWGMRGQIAFPFSHNKSFAYKTSHRH